MAQSLVEANGLHITFSDEAIAHAAERYAGTGNPRAPKRATGRLGSAIRFRQRSVGIGFGARDVFASAAYVALLALRLTTRFVNFCRERVLE